MYNYTYFMENDKEIARLELKTDPEAVIRQAKWAGLKPGMRVADIGCGPGKTTSILHDLVMPGGSVVGIDASEERICYAINNYNGGAEFKCKNAFELLDDLGTFDFVWVRFFLEYYRSKSFSLVENISRIVRPRGILCLIDLDYNCMSHFGISSRLEQAITVCMQALQDKADFDPFAGRKLYTYLYDLEYEEIDAKVDAHHLMFGLMSDSDAFNWRKKLEVISSKFPDLLADYEGGFTKLQEDFQTFVNDPRRFTYTPIISCRGRKKRTLETFC